MNHSNENNNEKLKFIGTGQSHNEMADLGVSTIEELLQRGAIKTPKAAALSAMGIDISYEQLEKLSAAIATWLTNQRLQPGARVAVALPNMLAHPVACLGIIRAGLIAVCVNPLYTSQELAQVFRDSEVKAVFLFAPMRQGVQQAMLVAGVNIAVHVTPGDQLGWRRALINWVVHRRLGSKLTRMEGTVDWRKVVETRATKPSQRVPIKAEQTAFIIYSGGTTGQPKGVPISHRALLFNVAQQRSALRQHLLSRAEQDYVLLLAVPLYHILGLGNLLFAMAQGGKTVVVMNPRDTTAFIKEWSRHRISSFPGVNTLFNSLLENEAFHSQDFRDLALCIGAGMPVSESTANYWHRITGCHITEAYGMTETGLISCNPAGCSRPGSVGLPVAGIEISLRSENDEEITVGAGEICVRSPAIMAGYWRRPEDNAAAFTHDGFFRTGDIGLFDPDGYLNLVDRKKEMIISSGFKVFPSEIERVLNAHPGILESAVVPAPDEKAGEIPIAYVVRRQPYLDEALVIAHCEKHLASYKRPRRIIFRDALPKSNVGKILRKELVGVEQQERIQ